MLKEEGKATAENWVLTNMVLRDGMFEDWKEHAVSVEGLRSKRHTWLFRMKMRGLKQKEWMRWLKSRVRMTLNQQGRISAKYSGWSFSTEIDEVNLGMRLDEVQKIWDNMSGKELDVELVKTARA